MLRRRAGCKHDGKTCDGGKSQPDTVLHSIQCIGYSFRSSGLQVFLVSIRSYVFMEEYYTVTADEDSVTDFIGEKNGSE